jgi:hypothetical protein
MQRWRQIVYHVLAFWFAVYKQWKFHTLGILRALGMGDELMSWWRKIPHPTYGNCGGGTLDCELGNHQPIDEMDELFLEHDTNLWLTEQLDFNYERWRGKLEADQILIDGLKSLDVKKLKRPIYGRMYRLGAITVFSARARWASFA